MSLYYLILWNQVDILQKHFKKDHVHMRLWTRFYGTWLLKVHFVSLSIYFLVVTVNFARMVPNGLLVFFPSYPVMNHAMEIWQVTPGAHFIELVINDNLSFNDK